MSISFVVGGEFGVQMLGLKFVVTRDRSPDAGLMSRIYNRETLIKRRKLFLFAAIVVGLGAVFRTAIGDANAVDMFIAVFLGSWFSYLYGCAVSLNHDPVD